MRGIIFLITISIVFSGYADWEQIGQEIDGEAAADYLITSVSLSADGSVVAIGAYGNDGNGIDAGHVRVYTLDNGTWVQTGQDIDGENEIKHITNTVPIDTDAAFFRFRLAE